MMDSAVIAIVLNFMIVVAIDNRVSYMRAIIGYYLWRRIVKQL